MALNNRQNKFVEEYLRCFNATEAAINAGYSEHTARQIGSENLSKPDIKSAIQSALDESSMGAGEVIVRLTNQARARIGDYLKVVEEWTFYPLPMSEVIDAKEVVDDSDPDNPKTRINYWVRRVVVDVDKLINPELSEQIAEISDSPRSGISIKLYNKQNALMSLAKLRGMVVDRSENNISGEIKSAVTIYIPDNGRQNTDTH